MDEIWKDIKGYEGLYQVSNLGRVKSLRFNERILKAGKDHAGYIQVSLSNKNFLKTYRVHRLVALVFISNSENKPEINHKDCIKSNNRVDNLEWVTPKENLCHAVNNGLTAKGERNGMSKITNQQAEKIREKYIPRKYTQQKLANEYGVTQNSIFNIVNNLTH